MPNQRGCQVTYARLKGILQKHAKHLTVTQDEPNGYALDAGYSAKFKRNVFFGAVAVKKRYVSFYLMPVYIFPDLLKGISPALKKRMQGKSCFNFTTIDAAQLKELGALTRKGLARYKLEKLLI
jgi:hypothetical protein